MADEPAEPGRAPATLGEGLDQVADQLGAVASSLRDLLARASLFDGAEYARWQLLSVLNSLGIHEGTVRQLHRLVDRRDQR